MNFKKVMVSFFILSLIFSSSCRPFVIPLSPIKPMNLKSSFGYFTENKGQWNREILFVGDTKFGSVAFARDGFYYQLIKKDRIPGKYTSRLIKFVFVRPLSLTVEGENILPHYNNYFVGAEPRKWNTECRNYGSVYYKNVWNGIDMAFFFTKAGLKYEFYVTPKANIDDLRIRVVGANLSVVNNSLQINATLGLIQDDGLTAWDQIDKSSIPATFTVQNKDTYFFAGIPKLRKHTITIDPLVYSTYLGGASEDQANAIVVDSIGYAYSAGFTYSSYSEIYPTNLPIIPGVNNYNGGQDAFVSKIAPDGKSLDAFTYFGGTGDEIATAIALDSVGNVYTTGSTTTIVSTSNGGPPIWFDNYNGPYGPKKAFVLKLNSNLEPQNQYNLSTFIKYIGGVKDEIGNAIAVDSSTPNPNVYITGSTTSFNQLSFNGGPPIWFDNQPGSAGNVNSFVVKLKFDLTPHTINFFGSAGIDIATSIAVQGDYVYITGSTTGFNQQSFNGGPPIWFDGYQGVQENKKAFILKLPTSNLVPSLPFNFQTFMRYIGGAKDEIATAITIDSSKPNPNVYITGSTTSFNQLSFNGGPPIWFDNQPGSAGNVNSFVVKLSSDFTTHNFNYFGGTKDDIATAIAVQGNFVYITGYTTTNTATANGGPPIWFDLPNSVGGGKDIFVLKLPETIVPQIPIVFTDIIKYIGSSGDDSANAIALDKDGSIYITGYTLSPYSGSNPFNWFDTDFGANASPDALIFKVSIP